MKLVAIDATVAYPPRGSGNGIPVIEIEADNGLVGWGEAPASRAADAVCDIVRDLLAPAVKGRLFRGDRNEIGTLWNDFYALLRNEGQTGGFTLEAIAAVDLALWDLAGKSKQRPVYLGITKASGPVEVPSFVSIGCAADDILTNFITGLWDEGFEVLEVDHCRKGCELVVSLDILKEAQTEGRRFAVNARWRLDPAGDFELLHKIDQRGPLWLANPLAPEDVFAHARLSRRMCTPFALGECYHTHYELAPFFHENAVGVLRINVARCGLTEAFRLAETARSCHIPIVVAVSETLGPQLAAALQFAASGTDARVQYSRDRLEIASRVLKTPFRLKQGKYQLPAAPGLGIEIDEAELHLMETRAA